MTFVERTLQSENGFVRNEQNGLGIIIMIRNRFGCDTREDATYGGSYEKRFIVNDQQN